MNRNRRRALLRLGALSAAAGLAGCDGLPDVDPEPDEGSPSSPGDPGYPSPETTPETAVVLAERWGFEGTVDLVEAGADPTGETAIDGLLEEHLGPRDLVYLPEGRYHVSDTVLIDSVDRVGIVGDAATIVPSDGNTNQILKLGGPSPVGAALCRGIEFDYTADDTGGRPLLAKADDRVLIDSVRVRGEADVDQDLVRLDVTDPEGTGVVRGLRLPDGAPGDTKVTGCQVGDENLGDLRFVDCWIHGFPDNGLYADPPRGRVEVLGGRFHNNGIAGVRVEVNDPAVVRGVHVRCDDSTDGGDNMRGIRLRAGDSVLVEQCLVELLDVTSSDGAVVFSSELAGGTVRDCHIRVDADGVNAVRLKRAADPKRREGPFRCESLTIVGTAGGGAAIRGAYRSNCRFTDLCVHQSGPDRDGFTATGLRGRVSDSRISITGEPFDLSRSSLARSDVSVDRLDGPSGGAAADPCVDSDYGSDIVPGGE